MKKLLNKVKNYFNLNSEIKEKRLKEILKHGVFVDVESAGLDPELNGILSIGATTIDCKEYYGECHLYSFQKAERKALEINGFTEVKARDMEKDSAHEMVRLFIEWCRSNNVYYIIGKNSRWDYEMIKYPWDKVFAKDGPKPEPFPLSHRVIDLTSLAAMAYIKDGIMVSEKGINSSELQKYLGIPDEPKPHDGLTGARYNRNMLLKLIEKIL
jgi:hypothetical protein